MGYQHIDDVKQENAGGSHSIDPSVSVNYMPKIHEEPSLKDEISAAFRVENLATSQIVDETNGIDNTPDPDFDWKGSLQGTEYENDLEFFYEARNEQYLDALKLRYNREQKDRETLEAGGWSAMGWSFVAALLGPENLIPGTLAVKSGKAGYSALKSARNVGAAGFGSVTIAEYGLQESQGLRTGEESLLNIGFGTAFSGMFGAGLATVANKSFKSNWATIFDQANRKSEAFETKYNNSTPEERIALLEEAKELAKDYRIEEVKAMAKLSDELKARIANDDTDLDKYFAEAQHVKRANSAGAAADMPTIDELGIFGKAAAKYGEKTRFLNPVLRNMNNPSQHARLMAANLFENPIIMKMNNYRDSPTAVETKWKQWIDGRLAEALRKIVGPKDGVFKQMLKDNIQMSKQEFKDKVGQALRKNDGIDPKTGEAFPEFNKHVIKAAQTARNDIFEELRKELNKVGLELDSKASRTALSYFTRVYNVPELFRKEGWFKQEGGPVWDWVKRALDHEIEGATRRLDRQINNIQSQIDDLKDAKLRRQSDLEFRETGEAGRLHKELNDIDSEISRLEAELERLAGEAEAPAKASDVAEQNINDLLKAFGTNMELGENFNSGFLRQMGLDRSQIDDFMDYLMQNGYLRERKDGHMQVRKLPDGNEKLALRSPDDPKADHVDEAIYNKLVEDANRILPDEYKFETPETLGGNIGGKVNLDAKLVEVALDAPDIATKLRHEALHALRDRFKPDEWEALRKASKEIEFKNEAAYRGYGVKGDELEEERIANLIEYAYKGGDISKLEPKALSTLEKIVAWIKALATTLKKPEYNKLQTILDDMESGAIGRRSQGGSKGDDLYSLKDGTLKTDTPAFKRWFGDSKVVDENGEPLVVYHGTKSTIEVFDTSFNRTDGSGFWFSDAETANKFAVAERDGDLGSPNVIPVYLKISNPFEYNPVYHFGMKVPEILNEAKRLGHDGVVFKQKETGKPHTYVAFDPTQIKSTNNRGTFDPNDPRILYQMSDNVDLTKTPAFKKWFGDSKVVDESGEPLTVSHGGYGIADIEMFDRSFAGDTTANNEAGAFHFVDDTQVSEDYARQSFNRRFQDDPESLIDEGIVDEVPEFNSYEDQYAWVDELAEQNLQTQDVFLKIENPVEIDMKGEGVNLEELERIRLAIARGYDEYGVLDAYVDGPIERFDQSDIDDFADEIDSYLKDNYEETTATAKDYQKEEAIREVLLDNGIEPEYTPFDGIIIRNMIDDIGEKSNVVADQYIVFDPTQIKSIHNRGTFDPNDPRIMYSLNEDTPEGITARIEELQANREKILDDIDKIEGGQEIPLNATADDVRAMIEASQSSEKAKMPETLSKFLTRAGGLIDESGELKFMGLSAKTHPKLVVSNDALMKQGDMLGGMGGGTTMGMSFDEATLKAWEEGFYAHRPSISELLDDLSEDINGNPFVRQAEAEELNAYYDRLAIEEELSMLGIDPKNKNFRYTGGPEQTDVVRAAYRALDKQADAKIKKLEAKKLKLEEKRNQIPSSDDPGSVEEIVNSIFDRITGRAVEGEYKPFDNIIDFGFLKGRTFGIPDEVIKDILVDDVEMVMRRYVRNAAGQVEMKKRFGTMDLRPHFEKIQEDFDMLRQELRANKDLSPAQKDKAIKRLKSQEKQTIKDMQFARDKILGRYEHDVDPGKFGRAVQGAMAFQYLISLGGVLATSLTDIWRTPMTQGFRRTFGKALPALIAGSKGIKMNRELARKYVGIAETIHNSRLHELSGLKDPFEQMSPAEVALQKMTDNFSRLTGLPYWNQFLKEFNAAIVTDRLIENMLKGIDNLSPHEARYMRSLNLGDASSHAKQWKADGVIEQIEGVWTVDADRLPPAIRDMFFSAVKREVDTSVVTPGIGDKPILSNTPVGGMFTQFKSFGFASNQRMLMKGMQDPTGRFWAALSGMVLTGMFIYALKQKEAGREIDDNPATWVAEGLDRSGMFYMFFEVNNIFEKLRGPGVYTALGAREPASRFASRNMLASFAPLIGTFGDVTNVGSSGLSYLNPMVEGDATPGDVKSVRRLTPYASLPYWRWLVDGYAVPMLQDEVR